ncbi:hypothetical protein H9P43_009689 [Blastocladiella emersonii ATCC 22665]|nr:hypothetical protein H9P43_009689 [Blastocladiella emersonii ATCC 22665]
MEVDTPEPPQVKFAELTKEAIEACVNAPVVNKNGEQAELDDTDKAKMARVLLAFAKSGMDIHNVDAVSKAVATYRATKGSKNVQGLQVETLKALAKYCTWNGWTELGAKYTEAKKRDADASVDVRKELESGALPSRAVLLAAAVAAEKWDKLECTGTMRYLRLYLQVVCATRSDLAFLTTAASDKYPFYDPATKTLAGPVCVKTEGRGYEFSHVIADPNVAAALERVMAKRKEDGYELLFFDYAIKDLEDAKVNAAIRKDWSKTIGLATKKLKFDGCGVQQIRRIATSENAAAYAAITQRANEMGHSVPVAVKNYMV